MINKKELIQRACSVGHWLVKNQIKRSRSADYGRYLNEVFLKERDHPAVYSTNWTAGMSMIGLIRLYERTKNKAYLESAKAASEYIKTLQILYTRNKALFGMIREETPMTDMCHPRDALSAAWGLLLLFKITKDRELLERATLFADWFYHYAMKDGYPAWSFFTAKEKKPYWRKGSFHGGSPLFFFELYKTTKNTRWKKTGLQICDSWIKTFPKEDGSIRIEVDPVTGRDYTGIGPEIGWQNMHKTNDDFTILALIRAYELSHNWKYRAAAANFLDWILTIQEPDGAFGNPAVNSAAPVLILELTAFYNLTHEGKYKQSVEKSVSHFLSLQELAIKTSRIYGGFYCTSSDYKHGVKQELGLRTSSYAILALLCLEKPGKRYL